jgi:glycerophosphoryl diester phosphodiesterase
VTQAKIPLLLGHRGARSYCPENTFEAFDLALAHGCDGFEFDVRLTADGRAVICHDAKTKRTNIARATHEQLRELPQLRGVLERYASRAFLDIELKVEGIEAETAQIVRQLSGKGYVVSSFLPAICQQLLKSDPDVVTGLICENQRQWEAAASIPTHYVMLERQLLSEGRIWELHQSERKVLAWTVNDASEMKRLASWGVDGIISDDTALIVQTLRPSASAGESRRSIDSKD